MGKKATGSVSTGRFSPIGQTNAPRRANKPGGNNRKYYPYPRKDQMGTPMEKFIDANEAPLEQQYNATHNGPGRYYHNEPTGSLQSDWQGVRRPGISGRSISKFIGQHGGTSARAKERLNTRYGTVSFGADPKRR